MPAPAASAMLGPFSDVRQAQQEWTLTSIASRLRIVRRIRDRVAAEAKHLARLFPVSLGRSVADSISSEILPLAEACRFLELEAERILAARAFRRTGRPFWLRRVSGEIRREPWGIVLVIGPANYPLFLAGVPMLQALVAGNAVLLKPGVGGARVLERLAELAYESGVPRQVLVLLDESVDSATEAIERGVDKIVMTGSVGSGRGVLRRAAEHVTPVVLELSGDDAVFVLATADVARAARAVAFGLGLNGGQTCIAPRRVFVDGSVADEFRMHLRRSAPQNVQAQIEITEVEKHAEALRLAALSPYALGASLFGKKADAVRLARDIRAGVIVINDMIVPTADPRVPFGGRGLSGFGVTRGEEGLLQMTTLKAVVRQRARRLRHLEPLPHNAEDLFAAYLNATHRWGFVKRLRGSLDLARAIRSAKGKRL